MSKKSIINLSLAQLQKEFDCLGLPKYTAKQLMDWVYNKRITSLEQVTNISKQNLKIIEEHFDIGRYTYKLIDTSEDGTKKYLFDTQKGNIETVMIPEDDRFTLCISCQIGCKMNCSFCMTGKCGFSANLSAGDIVNQVLSVDESVILTNIVFMGMGEPFDNLSEVLKAIEILTSLWGLAWSPKRITVSTSGLIKGTKEFLDKTRCHLAVSLHNPFPEERKDIMPIENSNSIKDLIALLKQYDFTHQRRLSFEYIVFEGLNDSIRHAQGMVKMLKGIFCRVNLIRFHEVEGLDFKSPNMEKMQNFRDYLNKNNIISTVRRSRGEDIAAACGQLKNSHKTE
ncbi:ribosomal RNA large subunit methyltransferase N [Porphyromonadaceae bacterium COT-184 OH4590]|nr:ribosomal RNA large subunit methyltransferase N [Porphyromonadaceae bacterium COT-184 OH4590]